MAISYMEIDTGQLNSDIRSLEESTAKVRSSVEGLTSELAELNAMWKGSANIAFRKQIREDMRVINTLLAELDKLASCMVYASNEYVRCENEAKSSVNSIRI